MSIHHLQPIKIGSIRYCSPHLALMRTVVVIEVRAPGQLNSNPSSHFQAVVYPSQSLAWWFHLSLKIRHGWLSITRRQVGIDYRTKCLYSAIGCLVPTEFEAAWLATPLRTQHRAKIIRFEGTTTARLVITHLPTRPV